MNGGYFDIVSGSLRYQLECLLLISVYNACVARFCTIHLCCLLLLTNWGDDANTVIPGIEASLPQLLPVKVPF